MKTLLYIAMVVTMLVTMLFNVEFAFSNVDCPNCGIMLFLFMTAVTSLVIISGFRWLYNRLCTGTPVEDNTDNQ